MKFKLSVIIVNYNVKAFLEQCLYAVLKAVQNMNAEVFVVDNNSVDDSVEMLKAGFPQIRLIENSKNLGFAVACNQAINLSDSEYILLLNPDTIVKEDCFELCAAFMDNHPDAGALGVRMIDGKGKFLPESKRSLPTASSAFYKIFGFSYLFPKSRVFGKYQLKYLDENLIHQVEVLSGAFMFIRKSVLEKTGLLDESFFMYGEDIDLSYRILKAGYKNYYFPNTTIIHFKGESTKKGSFRYVRLFYQAMLIFSKKHYKGRNLGIFRLLIHLAIYFRASLSLLHRAFRFTYLPLTDFLVNLFLFVQAVSFWEEYKFGNMNVYSDTFTFFYIPSYILVWMIFLKYYHAYTPYYKMKGILKAVLSGTLVILVIYSLLPEQMRYSRALILIGAGICFFSVSLIRYFHDIFNRREIKTSGPKKAALLIGNISSEDFEKYEPSLSIEYEIIKKIKFEPVNSKQAGGADKINEMIDIFKIKTILFFLKDIPASEIINTILSAKGRNLEFKMVLPLSATLVGPQKVIDLNFLPDFKINPVSLVQNLLKKRLLDISISVLFLLASPLFLLKNRPAVFFSTLFLVIINRLTWVSYMDDQNEVLKNLPKLKPGIFKPSASWGTNQQTNQDIYRLNLDYAKNYHVFTDLMIIFKALKKSLNLQFHTKQ